MGRRLIAVAAVVALVAGCVGIGGPEPTYRPLGSGPAAASGGGSASGGGGASGVPGGQTGPPEPSARPASWATLARLPDGTVVEVTGRVKAGFLVSCYAGICGIDLEDSAGGSGSAILDVPAVAAPGVPGTMTTLPEHYTEADLHLTADDGTAIASGDVVTVVGAVRQGDGYTVIAVRHLRTAPEPSPTPQPSARTVSFATLAKVAKGSVVRVRGRLALPAFTFCTDRICSIALDEPAGSRTATLLVPAIGADAPRRNGMLPLPGTFTDRDLAVYLSTGKRVGAGALVWVTATVDDGDVGKARDLRVSVIEPG